MSHICTNLANTYPITCLDIYGDKHQLQPDVLDEKKNTLLEPWGWVRASKYGHWLVPSLLVLLNPEFTVTVTVAVILLNFSWTINVTVICDWLISHKDWVCTGTVGYVSYSYCKLFVTQHCTFRLVVKHVKIFWQRIV